MKIYLLRHEKRFDNRNFDTDLTNEGMNSAKNLVKTLESLNLDDIFVSPYKRVIQTIEPYLKKNNKKVKPEYGINESLHLDDSNINIRDINDNLYGYEYMDKDYRQCVNKEELNYGETYLDIKNRSGKFIKKLISNNNFVNSNILLVCHLSVINAILDRNEFSDYSMGKLVLFYDSGYITTEII